MKGVSKKKKKKSHRVQAEGKETPTDGGHMASTVMALLSSQAGDMIQARKHLDASRMKELDESELMIQKKSIHERLSENKRGSRGLSQVRASDFIFDGQQLPPPSWPTNTQPQGGAQLQPLDRFPEKNDTLIGAFFARDASKDTNEIFHDANRQFTRKALDLDYANAPRVDGTINNIPIVHDVTEASRASQHYRWTNKIANTTALPQQKLERNFVLVEEGKIGALSQFEATLRDEHDLIASRNYGDDVSLTNPGDGESKVGQQLPALILNHDMIDPRVPTKKIVKALKKMNGERMDLLIGQWRILQSNWSQHTKANHYNEHAKGKFLFQEYTEDKLMTMTHDEDGANDWLLRNCPVHLRARKLKMAKEAYDSFSKRRDRDSMLYEDDRSFLYSQIYEANMRTLDYERYVFLCGLFGPMSKQEWAHSGSQPGTKYWIRATIAVTKIQHAWDRYWSTYKLHRYRAARSIQTAYRCHWGWKNLHPIVLIRQKIGKRTYYFFCWAAWTDYNYRVKRIAALLHFHKYNWSHKTFDGWREYVRVTTREKKAALARFRRRFDIRMHFFSRMDMYRQKSLRLKCMLRNMYYIPQFQMWRSAVAAWKRERELGEVVTPVQSWFRMRSQYLYFQLLQEKKWVFLKLGLLLKGKAKVSKVRRAYIADAMQEWGPDELARRATEKVEIERRRQIRENQLAQEKALSAVSSLQRHFKNWAGKLQLREMMVTEGIKRKDKMEYEVLKRCFIINYEQSKHEYRIKKGPHIICADPLCHRIFSSDEEYLAHIDGMMNLSDKSQLPRGVLKKDVYQMMAVDSLIDVVTYVDDDKAAEIRQAARVQREKRKAFRASQRISPEEGDEDKPAAMKSVLGAKKELKKVVKKSATELYAEKKALEEAKKKKEEEEEDKRKKEEEEAEKRKKSEKKKRAKARRMKREQALRGSTDEDGEEKETAAVDEGRDSKKKVPPDDTELAAAAVENVSPRGEATATESAATSVGVVGEVAPGDESTHDAEVSSSGNPDATTTVSTEGRGEGPDFVAAMDRDKEAEMEASGLVVHEGIRRHVVFPSSNFARFHILLKHTKGQQAVRDYLSRKHGVCPLISTLDCWDAIQMWRLGSVVTQNEPFIVRALQIYETFLSPRCARPIEIVYSDGNILTNAYQRAHQAGHSSMSDMLHFDHHDQEGERWWEEMVERLEEVKGRKYAGFYGTTRARPSTLRKVIGLRGKPYLCWTDKNTLYPDLFDSLEWACFQTIYKNIYYFDTVSRLDQLKNAEIAKLKAGEELVKVEERQRREQRARDKAEATVKRLQRERDFLADLALQRRRRVWLADNDYDVQAWVAYIASEKKEEEEEENKAAKAGEASASVANEESATAVISTDEAAAAPAADKISVTPTDEKGPPPGTGVEGRPLEGVEVEKRKQIGKGAAIYNPIQPGAPGSHETALPPFYHSREYAVYAEARESEATRQSEAFLSDFTAVRKKEIAEWTTEFKELEMKISAYAQKVVERNWEIEVNRLTERAAKVWADERVVDYSEKEQIPREFANALADDAVAWAEEKELDHLFDFYGNALLVEMLTHEEMVEGMMEYAGFLKGQKQLKKHLKIEVKAAGVREDLTWLKECLKEAIADDMKHLPLDYMAAVRLVQRRLRGWLGRSKARRKFSSVYLKKYDAETKCVYYVNSDYDPPEVTWERPKFMHHLWPGTTW